MYFSKVYAVLSLAAACGAFSVSAETVVTKLNPHAVEVDFDGGAQMLVDFYGDNIFRLFSDPDDGIVRPPVADPPAQILVDSPRADMGEVTITSDKDRIYVTTSKVKITLEKKSPLFSVTNLSTGKTVVETLSPVEFDGGMTKLSVKTGPGEYFYGGGVQNGRFSHRGKTIEIRNTNSWTDGGVASPTPYYWSTGGYGMMWHTFAPGSYDFGATDPGVVSLSHEIPYLDMFFMVSPSPVGLLNDFYQLTGNPVLLPKFGFYEGHLNAYNRDYWKEDDNGILYEDGKKYKESQTDNGGIRESLNGELPGNYQFSARAVIDRYNAHDMPLGWILPNDGYGAGYGQTSTLDGNVQNLREFGEYARKHGVEIGLWTQSDLHPKDGIEPLLQRDIVKEVRDAGVRVLKTDVAWVGAGYSFGLNGVADVGEIMPYYGNDARPFIISLDGWAGTQRYAGIWTGDQTGGEWEYIRFHIPTYIGSGLSGQPNITSDMDGIFGGRHLMVNIRDFQWKTFTPMELNMDGWGANPKYPQAIDGAEGINRAYLKLKSELLPYAYTAAREAVDGKPMIRAMFLDYPNDYTHGPATGYQFMYGPSFLVAPIYQETLAGDGGADYRNNIYLPEGTWFDYFSGDKYTGGVVWNYFESPAWKLPVFVKADAIVPMVNPNNNPSQIDNGLRIYELWPQDKGEYTEYDDDGATEAYRNGVCVTTHISSSVKGNELTVAIDPSVGTYSGFNAHKATELHINVSEAPKSVSAAVGGKKVKLTEVSSLEEFKNGKDVYFLNETPNRLKQFGAEDAADMRPQLWVKLASTDVTANAVKVQIKGFVLNPDAPSMLAVNAPAVPVIAVDENTDVQPYSICLRWKPAFDAECVEIEHDGMLYTHLMPVESGNYFVFENLKPSTEYSFKVRAKNPAGMSEWTEVSYTTKDNPLEFAISGISATSTADDQPGFGLWRLFDFEERGDVWHTHYANRNAVPFDIVMDLGSFNRLDRFDYLPRHDAGNGTITAGSVAISENGTDWTELGDFKWQRSSDTKTFGFDGQPLVRYIKMHVTEAVGGFGSGRELFVFKVPGTPSYLPGDINNDGKIDENDLMSYTNYTGLRRGDSDFEYVSMGDVNRNGLIDAYDISVVATRLNGGVDAGSASAIAGTVTVSPDKRSYAPGDEVRLTVSGKGLSGLNAVSMALPYDPAAYEYVGVEPVAVGHMENLTYDRLHTAGDKVLYPTFVNLGDKTVVEGDSDLFVLKFRAKVRGAFSPKPHTVILVDKALGTIVL